MIAGEVSDAASPDLVLPPDATAPGRARRLLAETLAGTDLTDCIEAGELALSEVVTNAALHARTPVEIAILVRAGEVRVEVRDYSPVVPRQRHYGEQATTGRGMALVASITSSCGVTLLEDGKIVWFVLRAHQPEPSAEDILAAFDDGQWDMPPVDPLTGTVDRQREQPGLTSVHLLGIPPTLWMATRRHHDAILRELVLYVARHREPEVDFAGAEAARHAFSNAVVAAIEDAQRGGVHAAPLPVGHPSPIAGVQAPIDLSLDLPKEAGPAAAALQDALDTAEGLAVEGKLLTFPGQPEVVAVRDWLCEQIQSQLHGVAARPWSGTADERFERTHHHAGALDETSRGVVDAAMGSGRGVVASDEGNRILAVSERLASLLGWEVDDLQGRRIVVLIPPGLREAHIAGFSRHLSTGESHVLGVPLVLPVLRADGTEVLCEFLVERVTAAAGRSVFLAWIEPAEV